MPFGDAAPEIAYVRSRDQDAPGPVRHPVVVVGAGPVGLTCALDLARQGVSVVVLDDDDTLSTGSRAICFAKRTLEIWDRLGCGDRMVDKGVSWNVGKVFFQDELVYRFDLLEDAGHRRPAFINLQQYYVEGFLLEAAQAAPNIELRWKNKVVGLDRRDDRVALRIETPDGPYALEAEWLVACDGSRSPLRGLLGQKSAGHTFRDRFLIADVKMSPATSARFAAERWFWFDPPFHRGQSVLLHRQPDDVWRIDFQLGWDADPVAEREPERVATRVRALLGEDAEFEFVWMSVYTFSCLRMDRFRHGRVLFAGDSAHGVSPFGARGANSGVQDADNLAWKLGLVLTGRAPERLLDSYDDERVVAADENILNSTRSTDFITPKSPISKTFRDAVLRLAQDHPFARRLVNSGRLSVPTVLSRSSLNTPDIDPFDGSMGPGVPCADAPVVVDGRPTWFLDLLQGVFTLVHFVDERDTLDAMQAWSRRRGDVPMNVVTVAPRSGPVEPAMVVDAQGLLASRCDARPGTTYLIRPDQHVCARWRAFDPALADRAIARATCNDQGASA